MIIKREDYSSSSMTATSAAALKAEEALAEASQNPSEQDAPLSYDDIDYNSAPTISPKISKSSDEDSDNSVDIQDVDKTPHTNLKQKRGDSKKPRSRSRSITPPPQVPLHQLQNARNIVRKALGVSHITSTPELDDDFRLDETQNRLPRTSCICLETCLKATCVSSRVVFRARR
ncbi:hypothetical protein K435DRAFT_969948 [Dendrothele bispora CBS 962.96]|uniref:Uncharacterized protein n=1 Tax=Dendrothele bispora (strain CBS 962.96) TaxID=1314807 RepID=A0A4S8LED1_DENBC|nr:hypothetical protein K435DRAFT_969948 [Dendrothele bispora CBS 962.96]